jgi:hypothetical protein
MRVCIIGGLGAVLYIGFDLSEMGSHCRVLNRGDTRSDLVYQDSSD